MESGFLKSSPPICESGRTSAISCRDLVVTYGNLVAVNGLTLEVFRGECFGLLGPNGAGKTTAIEVFEGFLKPRSGSVKILGEEWGKSEAADRRLRHRLGVALQETHFPERLTVLEIIRLFRSFYHTGRKVEELITLMGLEEKRNSRVGKLSSGQRQRLAIACALVGNPELVFLDEPTTGLDPHARLTIWQVVEDLTHNGCTVLLTTHYMEEAFRLCQRVGIIHQGSLIAQDTPQGLIKMLEAEEIVELKIKGELVIPEIEKIPGVRRVEKKGEGWVIMANRVRELLPSLLEKIENAGVKVESLLTHPPTLEDVFVHLTGQRLTDD